MAVIHNVFIKLVHVHKILFTTIQITLLADPWANKTAREMGEPTTTSARLDWERTAEGKSALRRKSSGIAALMTLNLTNNFTNIPIINEPTAAATEETSTTVTMPDSTEKKSKTLRFDTSPCMTEYDTDEVCEVKRRITDEIKRWVLFLIFFIFSEILLCLCLQSKCQEQRVGVDVIKSSRKVFHILCG